MQIVPRFIIPLLIVACILVALPLQSQVFSNADFEDFLDCPHNLSQIDLATSWFDATNGTADYYNACDTGSITSVPSNFNGFQEAHSGNGYAGIFISQNYNPPYREFIETAMNETLIAGRPYILQFYINNSDTSKCAPQVICAYFSGEPAVDYSTTGNMTPENIFLQSLCTAPGSFPADSVNWIKIEMCFIATGDEKYFMIGNNETNLNAGCDADEGLHASYIYIDDISLIDPSTQTVYYDTSFCKGNSATVDVSKLITEPANVTPTYLWNDGFTSPERTFHEEGNFEVLVMTGCAVDTVRVTINFDDNCPEIFYIPNAFSPNNDGVNDRFRITAENITVQRFDVYNRWGQLVFSSPDAIEGWDGTKNGVLQPMGVYLYMLDYTTNISEKELRKEGYITLIY